MNIDILKLRNFSDNPSAINVAFPVLAYECEVRVPLENELDAYEEAALKYISIGLAVGGIAKALNINESLSRQIVSKLEMEKFIIRQKGIGLKLTEYGEKYLIGIKEERPSDNSMFGFMFVSALKKDILPFFYKGDIGKIDRADKGMLECKLTDKDEKNTFAYLGTPKRWRLSQAYKRSLYIAGLESQQDDGEITVIEAQDIYADYDSFDEADYFETEAVLEKNTDQDESAPLGYGAFVRPLKRTPIPLYLKMQIIISPDLPGGFMVASPLDLGGIENDFFLRQVKWMLDRGDILYNNESLNNLINTEVLKLCGKSQKEKKDITVFLLERLPRLSVQRDKYSQIISDMKDVYGLMDNNMTQLARRSVVQGINRGLLEALFNRLLRSKTQSELQGIRDRAISDMNALQEMAVLNISKSAKIDRASLPSYSVIKTAINKLDATNRRDATLGHSIAQKLINAIVAYCYLPSPQIKKFVTMDGLTDCIETIMKLNVIRNKTSHDSTSGDLTMEDYNYYILNVFRVANRLLEALEEKN